MNALCFTKLPIRSERRIIIITGKIHRVLAIVPPLAAIAMSLVTIPVVGCAVSLYLMLPVVFA